MTDPHTIIAQQRAQITELQAKLDMQVQYNRAHCRRKSELIGQRTALEKKVEELERRLGKHG